MQIINKLISIIYPNRCVYCGEIISADESVCEFCVKNLQKIKSPYCEYCGCNKSECTCSNKKRAYKTVVAPFYYEGCARNAIHRMKFKDRPHVAKVLSKEISDCINERLCDVKFDIITFVPMIKSEMNKRGYNQSELLANHLEINGNPKVEPKLLKKLYIIPKQHTLNESQRQGNVLGVFDLDNTINIKDKIILLCDDVKTTGATANECASVLLDYGAKEVYLCCVAITRKDD